MPKLFSIGWIVTIFIYTNIFVHLLIFFNAILEYLGIFQACKFHRVLYIYSEHTRVCQDRSPSNPLPVNRQISFQYAPLVATPERTLWFWNLSQHHHLHGCPHDHNGLKLPLSRVSLYPRFYWSLEYRPIFRLQPPLSILRLYVSTWMCACAFERVYPSRVLSVSSGSRTRACSVCVRLFYLWYTH